MNIEREFRPPTAAEAEVIQRLVAVEFPGKDAISDQLRSFRVRRIDDQGSLEFHLNDAPNPAKVEKQIPVEAEAPDADGVHIHFLLHVVRGVVAELEIYKDDLSPIRRMPRAHESRKVAA